MNNREAASFIILGAVVVGMLCLRPVRSSMVTAAKLLLWSKVTVGLVAYIGVIGVTIYLASRLSLWTSDLLAATALWFLLTGFTWFLNLNDSGKDPDFFKRRFVEALGLAAFFEFFVNTQVLSLPLEIVGQLGLTVVVVLSAVARTHDRFRVLARLTSGILSAAGLCLLGITTVALANNWARVDKSTLRNELLMPIWLAAAAIALLYLVAFYMGYEALFARMSFMNDRTPPSLRAKVGIILGLRGALVDVASFSGVHARGAAQSATVANALAKVRLAKEERSAEEAVRARAALRLLQNAGLSGVDEGGLVLDRREFAQTKDALRWLATCHVGWYQREDRPNEYRRDLLDMLVASHPSQFAFESPESIVVQVRTDGQAWYAYRRAPSGHVFGMGADGPPPSQWFYDGPNPPDGFPSQRGRGWTHFMSHDRPEWRTEPATDA